MDNFDIKKIVENIYFLIKEKDLKIGEVESNSGISTGYLSRLKDSNTNINIESLYKIANYLNVTIDSLVNCDYSELSSTEKYMLNFLNKIIIKTNKGLIDWRFIATNILYNPKLYNKDFSLSPVVTVQIKGYEQIVVYFSLFAQLGFLMLDNMYYFEHEDKDIYLFKVRDNYRKAPIIYEMYLETDDGLKPLCSSNKGVNKIFEKTLEQIYQLAEKKVNEPQVDDKAKEIIDSFIKNF